MERVQMAETLEFSRIIQGFWRLAEWNMTKQELLSFIEDCMDMGITTFDHADIYGGYTCEGLFGEALQLKPSLRENMQIITKCGIAPHHRNFQSDMLLTTTLVQNILFKVQKLHLKIYIQIILTYYLSIVLILSWIQMKWQKRSHA